VFSEAEVGLWRFANRCDFVASRVQASFLLYSGAHSGEGQCPLLLRRFCWHSRPSFSVWGFLRRPTLVLTPWLLVGRIWRIFALCAARSKRVRFTTIWPFIRVASDRLTFEPAPASNADMNWFAARGIARRSNGKDEGISTSRTEIADPNSKADTTMMSATWQSRTRLMTVPGVGMVPALTFRHNSCESGRRKRNGDRKSNSATRSPRCPRGVEALDFNLKFGGSAWLFTFVHD